MKKLFLFAFVGFQLVSAYAQPTTIDRLYKHNGDSMQARVVKVDEYVINYILPDEKVQRTIGKLAVEKIVYGDGKTEEISKKIEVNGKKDWDKVLIVYEATAVAGLKKGEDISGKTPYWSVSNISKEEIQNKSIKNLKQAAARDYYAPIVLIISDQKSYKQGVVYYY